MKLKMKRGTTSKLLRVFIQDLTATDGSGLTGLVYNSSGLVAYYIREGDASPTAITLATMTVGTWATGGFKEVSAANMPGLYEFGVPDAVLASGASVTILLRGAVNMPPILIEIELDAVNYQSTTAFITQVNGVAPPAVDGSGRVSLAATGLDAMLTDVTSDANMRASGMGMLRGLFNRFFNLVTQTSSTQIVKNDAGTTISTMTTSDDGTTAQKAKSA